MDQEKLKQYAQEKLQKNQQLLQERQVFGESFNPTKLSISPQMKSPPQMLKSDILGSSKSSPSNQSLSRSQTDVFYVRVRKNLRNEEDEQMEELRKDQLIKKLQKEREQLTAQGLGQISPRTFAKSNYNGKLRTVLQKKEEQELSKFRKIATKLYERECDRLMKQGAAQIHVINLFQTKNASIQSQTTQNQKEDQNGCTLQLGCVFDRRQQIAVASFGCRFTHTELMLVAKYAGIREATFADFLEVPEWQRQTVVNSLLTRKETIVMLDRPTEAEGVPVITVGLNASLAAAAILNGLDSDGKPLNIDFGCQKIYLGDKKLAKQGEKASFVPKVVFYGPSNICNQFALCVTEILRTYQIDIYVVDEKGLLTINRSDHLNSVLARKDISSWGHRTIEQVFEKIGVNVLVLVGLQQGALSRYAETFLYGKVVIDMGGVRLKTNQVNQKQQHQQERPNGLSVAATTPSALTLVQAQRLLAQNTILASQSVIKYVAADGSQRTVQILSQVYLSKIIFGGLRPQIEQDQVMPQLPNDLILFAGRTLMELQAGRYCGFITPENAIKQAEIIVKREIERRSICGQK